MEILQPGKFVTLIYKIHFYKEENASSVFLILRSSAPALGAHVTNLSKSSHWSKVLRSEVNLLRLVGGKPSYTCGFLNCAPHITSHRFLNLSLWQPM